MMDSNTKVSDSSQIPEDANIGCVGPSSELAGKSDGCKGCPNQSNCSSGTGRQEALEATKVVVDRMAAVKHKILVLSGKGGVGKSTFSAQLAFALAQKGLQVGLLDIDICGPSIPRMLGLEDQEVHQSASGWSPVYVEDNLGVMSIGFMLPKRDDAVIWRGPRKNGLIKQFLTDVLWGDLDYLVIDTPPGTSDEHISIVQYLKESGIDGAVVVTTPQEIAMADVRKELNFCKKTGVTVLGVVENMGGLCLPLSDLLDQNSGLVVVDKDGVDVTAETTKRILEACPDLMGVSLRSSLFKPVTNSTSGNTGNTVESPETMAQAFGVPYLGCLPMDLNLARACENGKSLLESQPKSAAAAPLRLIVEKIIDSTNLK